MHRSSGSIVALSILIAAAITVASFASTPPALGTAR